MVFKNILLLLSSTDIYRFFENSIADNKEGIILKHLKSLYSFNSRKDGWYKLKPDYLTSSFGDLDLLAVGAYFSKNKQNCFCVKFLCAALEDSVEFIKASVICAVSLGLSYNDLKILNTKIKEESLISKKNFKKYIDYGKYTPDAYFDWERSFILQIKVT